MTELEVRDFLFSFFWNLSNALVWWHITTKDLCLVIQSPPEIDKVSFWLVSENDSIVFGLFLNIGVTWQTSYLTRITYCVNKRYFVIPCLCDHSVKFHFLKDILLFRSTKFNQNYKILNTVQVQLYAMQKLKLIHMHGVCKHWLISIKEI